MTSHSLIQESNIVNFLPLFLVLVYFAFKFLPQATKRRQSQLQIEIRQAQEAKRNAEQELAKLKFEIEQAKQLAQKILDDANVSASKLQTQAMEEAAKQISRLETNASREIEAHRLATIEKLKKQISEILINNLESKLQARAEDLGKNIIANLNSELKALK